MADDKVDDKAAAPGAPHVAVTTQTLINIEVGIARTQEKVASLAHRSRSIEQKIESLMPRREVEQVIAGAIGPLKAEQEATAARVGKIENTITWAARTMIAQGVVILATAVGGIAAALHYLSGQGH